MARLTIEDKAQRDWQNSMLAIVTGITWQALPEAARERVRYGVFRAGRDAIVPMTCVLASASAIVGIVAVLHSL